EERPELLGQAIARALRHEADAAVEVPAEDEDRAPGLRERRAHRGEVRRPVDQEGEPAGPLDAPAVAPRREETHRALSARPMRPGAEGPPGRSAARATASPAARHRARRDPPR